MARTGPRPIAGSLLVAVTAFVGVVLHAGASSAQISLDGTIRPGAPNGPLTGPDFMIPAEAGATHGNNLFHSFGQFNLQKGEKATFTGSRSIENVISRVTGGTRSFIDGRIDSKTSMPSANFFLLNPSGVLFGVNASLNIGGAFHVTTAGCVRAAGENCLRPIAGSKLKFFTDPSMTSVLTTDAPAAFGFLGTAPPSVISVENGKLEVSSGQVLSLVGGDVRITVPVDQGLSLAGGDVKVMGTTLTLPGGQIQILAGDGAVPNATLAAPGGRIYVESVGRTAGEAPLTMAPDASARLGQIALSRKAVIDASGSAGGTVLIRGGGLVMDDASILADTLGDEVGAARAIDAWLTGAMELKNGAKIGALTFGEDALGGEIVAQVGSLSLTGGAQIARTSHSLKAGSTGGVKITATDSVTISGKSIAGESSGLFSNAFAGETLGGVSVSASSLEMSEGGTISVLSLDTGASGEISLTGPPGRAALRELTVTGGATISSSVVGDALPGRVTVTADSVLLSGRDPRAALNRSGILSSSRLDARAGDISLNVGRLTVTNGAVIESGSQVSRQGGNVTVQARDSVLVSGGGSVTSQANLTDVGEVRIEPPAGGPAPTLTIDNGAVRASTRGGGDAGKVTLTVDRLNLTGGGQIQSSSERNASGAGGDVTITAADSVTVKGAASGVFSTTEGSGRGGSIGLLRAARVALIDGATISASSTGTTQALAGNVNLTVGDSLVMNNSTITTSARIADGGNISITSTGSRLHLTDSQVTTSVQSGVGVGGNITLGAATHPFDFTILDHSQVRADAFRGPGGNINIVADVLLAGDSVISASSAQNVQGTIEIQARVTDLSGTLTQLPAGVLQAATLLRASCAARVATGKASSLVLAGREGLPPEPESFLWSPLLTQSSADLRLSAGEGAPGEPLPRTWLTLLAPKCSR
jgi:filamentous hemagglutinin family protein